VRSERRKKVKNLHREEGREKNATPKKGVNLLWSCERFFLKIVKDSEDPMGKAYSKT